MTRRNLLADFNAAEDVLQDSASLYSVDYSFRASLLIKAHVQPHQQSRQQHSLQQWYSSEQECGEV